MLNFPNCFICNLRFIFRNIQVVSLEFTELTTEANHDKVRIYDGNSSRASLIATLSGISCPLQVYVTTQRFMLISFTTDDAVVIRGFSATYRSIRANGSRDVADEGE